METEVNAQFARWLNLFWKQGETEWNGFDVERYFKDFKDKTTSSAELS